MEVVLRLGLRYLWADQICINQNDPADKAEQLKWMHVIYSEADLTIVAAAGSDSAYGLPGVHERQRISREEITLNGVTMFAHEKSPKIHAQRSVWMSRGWTYQESFFSRRCLIFTDEQVVFQCKKTFRSEGMVNDDTDEEDRQPLFCNQHSKLSEHIGAYSRRHLTYESDVLNALEGLFQFARHTESVEHFWGVPIRWAGYHFENTPAELHGNYAKYDVAGALLHGLTWYSDGSIQSPHTNLKREGNPSWSWIGWKAPIEWRSVGQEHPFIVPVHVETASGGLVPVDEAFAAGLSSGADLGYTPVFKIETFVLQVAPYDWKRYAGNTSGRADLRVVLGHDTEFESVQFAIIKPGLVRTIGLIWPILRTAGTSRVDCICEEQELGCFECVVVSQDQGLVVHSRDGLSKRVGIVSLASKFIVGGTFMDWTDDDFGNDSTGRYTKVPRELQEDFSTTDLREHFPCAIKTIRLG
ncbi:hypothetical protein OPT61_g2791 [Boeremia exigua]|uniref:Uncharacterized protein n=1 Tax=Boeremia exigua TaxID=749465 RepID=A0ACC2IK86_9PLEO|nr:hypothetical protein OPT61_g2791 [Boeremia exigua]